MILATSTGGAVLATLVAFGVPGMFIALWWFDDADESGAGGDSLEVAEELPLGGALTAAGTAVVRPFDWEVDAA